MAVKLNQPFLIICLCTHFASVQPVFTAFNRPIPFVRRNTCVQSGTSAQFYDVSKLECVSCSQDRTYQSVSADGKSGHVLTKNLNLLNAYGDGWDSFTIKKHKN